VKVNRGLLAIVLMSCVGVVVARTAAADEWNKKTVLTFSRDVEIPGTLLPAGTYVFRLADSSTNRHVVQVFDQAGRILATVLTIPTARRIAEGGSRITFDEQPTGVPFPITTWFYPGDRGGEEFIYRTHTN
jgi:hypothetical protein